MKNTEPHRRWWFSSVWHGMAYTYKFYSLLCDNNTTFYI